MNAYRNVTLIAIAATAFAVFAPGARAQMIVEKITVTVSEPVEVPGLVLPIGNYVFEAMENGRLTRILSADESHIYKTLLTVPKERGGAREKSAVTLKDNPKGEVERIDAWFYPGDPIGNEFVYPGTSSDTIRSSKIGSFTSDVGHDMSLVIKEFVIVPEYLAVHAEHALVRSSVATGHFFSSRFLVV